MGDFNSRIKKLTGDHRNNPYGTILRNKMLNDFKIHTPHPTYANKYTFVRKALKQRSIIDLFLSRTNSTTTKY